MGHTTGVHRFMLIFSTDIPVLSSVRSINRGVGRLSSMTIHGRNIGIIALTSSARLGSSSCESTQWESETSTKCLVLALLKNTRTACLTVGISVGSMSTFFSVDKHAMSLIARGNTRKKEAHGMILYGYAIGQAKISG